MEEKIITIDDSLKGKPNVLTFKITQMPAVQMERFILRLLSLLGKSLNMEASDINASALLNAIAGLDIDKALPLYDEMLTCAKRIISDGIEEAVTTDMLNGYINKVGSLFKLRKEIVKFNISFLELGDLFKGLNPTQ